MAWWRETQTRGQKGDAANYESAARTEVAVETINGATVILPDSEGAAW